MVLEDRISEAKGWLTKFLTRGRLLEEGQFADTSTRVMSGEQLDYWQFLLFLGSKEGLDMDIFTRLADINMRLMISYKGLSREEVVSALGKLKEEDSKDVGKQPILAYLRGDRDGG